MIGLSIREPWATMIVAGAHVDGKRVRKDVECRDWFWSYRGPVLIHASKTCTRSDYADGIESIGLILGAEVELPPLAEMQRGGFRGIARVVECLGLRTYPAGHEGWHISGTYGFRLEDVEALPFVAYKGRQGPFKVSGAELPVAYRDAWNARVGEIGGPHA